MNKKLNKVVFFDYDENYELLFHYPTYNMLKIEKYYKILVSAHFFFNHGTVILSANSTLLYTHITIQGDFR